MPTTVLGGYRLASTMSLRRRPLPAVSPNLLPIKSIVSSSPVTSKSTDIIALLPDKGMPQIEGRPCHISDVSTTSQRRTRQKANMGLTCDLCSEIETEDSQTGESEGEMVTSVSSVVLAIASPQRKVLGRNIYDFETDEEFLTMEKIFNRILSTRPRSRLRAVPENVYERQYIDRSSLGSALLRASREFKPAHYRTSSRSPETRPPI